MSLPSEHRGNDRLGEALLISYWVHEDAPPEITETYDVAIGGIALLTHVFVQPGTELTMLLELRGDAHPPLQLQGAVRWSHNDPAIARYRTGVEFRHLDAESAGMLRRYIEIIRRIRDLGIFG